MRHLRSLVLASTTLTTVLVGATSAQAATICVNRVSNVCTQNQAATGTIGDQLQAAIDAAESLAGDDSLVLGGGTYVRFGGFAYEGGAGRLIVQGPGVGAATLVNDQATGASTWTFIGVGSSGPVTLTGLTVQAATTGQSTSAVSFGTGGSSIVAARVHAPSGASAIGIEVNGAPSTTTSVQDVVVDGPGVSTGIQASGANLDMLATTVPLASLTALDVQAGNATVRRSVLTSKGNGTRATVDVGRGTTVIENSVISAAGPVGSTDNRGVDVGCSGGNASVELRYVTVRAAPTNLGVFTFCSDASFSASVNVTRSVLAPGTTVNASAGDPISLSSSRWDGSGTGAVSAGAGMRTEDPQFVSADDLRLQATSPLLDALTLTGDPLGEPNRGDVLGAPRVSDANGDGTARADLGAYERQAPAVALPAGNLLANPGAEGGPATADQVTAPPPTGFTRTQGSFTQAFYGGAFSPLANVGTAFGAGVAYFVGGPGAASSAATQTVGLGAVAGDVDAGRVSASLSALLGAYGNEDDRATVAATYLDAGGQPVGTALTLVAPPASARGGAVTILPKGTVGAVPAGARSARVTLRADADPTGDSYLDASFDQVALTTATAPAVVPPAGGTPPPGSGGTPPGSGALPPGTGSPPVAAYRGLQITPGKPRLDSRGRVAVRVACPSVSITRCAGTLALTRTTGSGAGKRTTRLARRSVAVLRGKSSTVRLTITRSERRLVMRRGLAVVGRAVTKDARPGAVSRTTSAKLTLLPRKR